jgi:hypothetical protein
MRPRLKNLVLPLFLAPAVSLHAGIREQTVGYQMEGQTFEGCSALDARLRGKRPSVLIFHPWTGVGDNERMKAFVARVLV